MFGFYIKMTSFYQRGFNMMSEKELITYFKLKLELLDKKEKLGFQFPSNYRIELTKKLNNLLKGVNND